ncbi:MAG TPA: ABC transporter substrate-binding protein, partial [Candidatus Binatia bacterium]|nr:ABC transporter substrate-binding protein [Candidatus Binatia bacterium]
NIPRQSVTIFPAGDSAARIAALSAKAIDGTMLSYPDINEALRLGMRELVKMPEVKGTSFPMNVMVARRSFVEKNRDAVKRFQQAYAEGTYQFMTSREKGLAVLAKRLRFKNPKGLEETYDYFAKSFSMPTRVSPEGLRNTLDIIAQRNPGVKVDMNIGRYLDESIVDELDHEGFFKRLAGKS